jgi:2-methylisocitrate lyase-like PEP mutase family enzyme
VKVTCLPAHDEADDIACRILKKLLESRGVEAALTTTTALASERLEVVAEAGADIVCIASLPPAAVSHARYLVKRLRSRFPQVPIVVGLLGANGDLGRARHRLQVLGTEQVEGTLAQTLESMDRLIQPLLVRA